MREMCGNGYLVNVGGVKPQPLSFSILNQPIGSRRVTEALVLSAERLFESVADAKGDDVIGNVKRDVMD